MEIELVQEIEHAAALINNAFALGMTHPDTITAHHPTPLPGTPNSRQAKEKL